MALSHKQKKKILKLVWRHKKLRIAKEILKKKKKKEREESGPKVKLYTTKLQSSRQYGTGRKTEIQTNGTG